MYHRIPLGEGGGVTKQELQHELHLLPLLTEWAEKLHQHPIKLQQMLK